MFMQSQYNPGYVGWENQPTWWVSAKRNTESTLGVRGNGSQFNLNWQGQFPEWKSNLGVVFNYEQFNDNRGETSTNGTNGDRYDFKQWKLGLQHNFMFDIGNGKAQAGFGVSLMKFADIFTSNQGGLVNEYKFRPNVDVGLLAVFGNFEIGASVLHSNEPSFRDISAGFADRNAQFKRISYLQSSYEFQIGEMFYIKPNFMMRQLIGQGTINSCGVSIDAGVLFNLNDTVFASYSWGYHKQDYPHSVMVAYRLLSGYQISASMDISGNSGRERSRFEIGFGVYLFGEYYDDEEEETPEVR